MQVIIIDSVEALAIQIERELIKHSCDAPVVDSIISCLHPIEVPSDAGEVVNAIILLFAEAQVGQTEEAIAKAIAKAAALIESYGRRVPRAIDAIAGKLEEAIGEEDWNEAKSVLNDLWDLRDDGYKVEG